jgi:hypothetical protein
LDNVTQGNLFLGPPLFRGAMNCRIERDLYFEDEPFSQVRERARSHRVFLRSQAEPMDPTLTFPSLALTRLNPVAVQVSASCSPIRTSVFARPDLQPRFLVMALVLGLTWLLYIELPGYARKDLEPVAICAGSLFFLRAHI